MVLLNGSDEGFSTPARSQNGCATTSNCGTSVHVTLWPSRTVMLSATKHLTARPFAEFILSVAEGLRVIGLVGQSHEIWLREVR
jgi:hypothetical protein